MNRLTGYLRRIIPSFRRRHKRHPAPEGMYVVLGIPLGDGLKFQIIDVSLGGVAFIYNGSREDLDDFERLSITDGDKCFVGDVVFKPVTEQHLGDDKIRVGSEFKFMGVLEKARIRDFIDTCCYKT
jgi:c-di-GMP-binding flagellar brake protein YcgR